MGTSKRFRRTRFHSRYKGSQFRNRQRAALVPSVAAGDVVLAAGDTYYIISNYGDANSGMRSDIRVQASETDRRDHHPSRRGDHAETGQRQGLAGIGQYRMVGDPPGGDVIKESIGPPCRT